jgi:hypothetical protein
MNPVGGSQFHDPVASSQAKRRLDEPQNSSGRCEANPDPSLVEPEASRPTHPDSCFGTAVEPSASGEAASHSATQEGS